MYDEQLRANQGDSQHRGHDERGEVGGRYALAAFEPEEKSDSCPAKRDRKRVRVDRAVRMQGRSQNGSSGDFREAQGENVCGSCSDVDAGCGLCKRVCLYNEKEQDRGVLYNKNAEGGFGEKQAPVGLRSDAQHSGRGKGEAGGKAVLARGWREWLKAFFRRMGAKSDTKSMARWGRKHYGVDAGNDKKAIKQLAVILMGKQRQGAFKPVTTVRWKKVKSCETTVVMPGNGGTRQKKRSKKFDSFYDSWEWKKLRYQVLKKHGAKCMLCGRTPDDGAKICVDHIKPRALFPELELEESNLQVLCNDCNMGKGRWDESDWRKHKE